MSEAIIAGRRQIKNEIRILATNMITLNQNWVVPEGIKNNLFHVRIFGGGGGGGAAGGGGGWMNNADLQLTPGTSIAVTIGSGGIANNRGGGNGGSG